ncbi:MAG: glycosyltransferase family 2 protein [Patescibacteria group bacterium]
MFRKRTLQERFWEILPGLELWVVLIGAISLSFIRPVWAALFIICFDFYWLLRAINGSAHLVSSYFKFQVMVKIDWLDYINRLKDPKGFIGYLKNKPSVNGTEAKYIKHEIKRLNDFLNKGLVFPNYENFYHCILIPFVNESVEVISAGLDSMLANHYPKDKMILILASEERAGEEGQKIAGQIKTKYENRFLKFFLTVHPDGLEGEIKGKSANASYAIKQILSELAKLNITTEQVLISNFDSDTIVHPQYFARVMYEFLTAEKPYQKSYQPIAIYNNNIWDSPALIRVITISSWQFTESSRPDRLKTFSSHTMTLKALIEVGFWKKDIVNEDEFIYWQCFLRYNGDYQVIPLFLPVSLDTCLANTTWQTFINQYKQKRRWAYNVEYYPHLIWPLIKSKVPLYWKLYKLYQYMETNFTWATASIMIAVLGWLPLIVGGQEFSQSVVASNLPLVTKTLMRIALAFLIFSVYVNLILLPPRPKKYGPWSSISMYLQWFLVPISAVLFHSLPAIEAQTRLMFGRYLEFWVTPKARKGENTGLGMKEMQ